MTKKLHSAPFVSQKRFKKSVAGESFPCFFYVDQENRSGGITLLPYLYNDPIV